MSNTQKSITTPMEIVEIADKLTNGTYRVVAAVEDNGMQIKASAAVRPEHAQYLEARMVDEDGNIVTQGTLVAVTGKPSAQYSNTRVINLDCSKMVNLELNTTIYQQSIYAAPTTSELLQRVEQLKAKENEPKIVA